MSDSLRDPPRWKDRTDQSDVAERHAGHAVRCARAVPPRPAPHLSRVVARFRASRPSMRLTWVVATAALVLGLATAASAARLNLLPNWLARMVRPGKVTPTQEGARSPRAKARPGAPVSAEKASSPPFGQGGPSMEQTPEQTPSLPATHASAEMLNPVAATGSPAEASESLPARKVALLDRGEPPIRHNPTRPHATAISSVVARGAELANPSPRAMVTSGASAVGEVATNPWPAPNPTLPAPSLSPPGTSTSPSPALARTAPSATAAQAHGKQGASMHLTEAVRLLRVEHSPASALRILDGRDGELTNGGFGHEALILRVEALLALGRRAEVLRLLDSASLTDVAASRALLVTRGELRAAANRCAEGIGDFDLVLARSKQVDARALAGRALCRKQLGDAVGSRTDVPTTSPGAPE